MNGEDKFQEVKMKKFVVNTLILGTLIIISPLFSSGREESIKEWKSDSTHIIHIMPKWFHETLRKKTKLNFEETLREKNEALWGEPVPLDRRIDVDESVRRSVLNVISQYIKKPYFPVEVEKYISFFKRDQATIVFRDPYIIDESRFCISGEIIKGELSQLDIYFDNPTKYLKVEDVIKKDKLKGVKIIFQREERFRIRGPEEKQEKEITTKAIKVNLIMGQAYLERIEGWREEWQKREEKQKEKYYKYERTLAILEKAKKERNFEIISKYLDSPENYARLKASDILREIGTEKELKYFIKALDNFDYRVRSKAISAMITLKIKDTTVGEKLLDLVEEKEYGVAASAARLLGLMQFKPAVDKLIFLYENSDLSDNEDFRGTIISALGIICDEKALPFLERVAKNDPSKYNRGSAKRNLEYIKSKLNK